MSVGGVIKGEVPPNRDDVREGVPTQRGANQLPTTCKASKNTQRHRGVWGHMEGVYTLGVTDQKIYKPTQSNKNN